ncbi:MAG: exodeoxyribonuclease VII small subunit [Ignavibacteria bacterium]|nr:exodeoxyribonuclease VII small subunit [Ignavibacteria bacterium]
MESTFEVKLKRLQEIVNLLDKSSVTLDEAIKLYEEGMELAIELRKLLDQAELKIIQLNAKYSKQSENFEEETKENNDEF